MRTSSHNGLPKKIYIYIPTIGNLIAGPYTKRLPKEYVITQYIEQEFFLNENGDYIKNRVI